MSQTTPTKYRVICIQPTKKSGKLKLNQEYIVIESRGGMFYRLDGDPTLEEWNPERFQILEKILQGSSPSPAVPTMAKSTKPIDPKEDAEETRLRAMMRPSLLPGYCACGIHRSKCDYHR